jgi:hypothetical protein
MELATIDPEYITIAAGDLYMENNNYILRIYVN